MITSGANGTGTYFVQMDKIAHTDQKVGLASAMAVVLLVIILICALLQKIVLGVMFGGADDGTKAAQKAARKARRRNKLAMRRAPLVGNGGRAKAMSGKAVA